MSRVLTNEQNYYDIADTIRQMKNVNTTYKPRQMASALKDIYSNEVEGTLPLTFQANGNNLLNYRIDGASGGVGERTKNLLQNTATTQTVNGVTFTVNEDGSVTCNTDENGATADTRFYLLGISGTDFKRIECDTAIKLTGCPSGGSSSTYYIALLRQNDSTYPSYNSYADFGNGFVPSYDATNKYVIYIQIKSGQVCTNLTFYPMIRKADIEDNTYEPYGYKVPVVVNGKNLLDFENPSIKSFNLEKISNGIYQANTNNAFLANRWALDTEAGVQYRILGTTNNSEITIQLSDFINGTSSPQGGQIRANESINLTFTATGKTTLSIFSRLANQSFTATNFQIYKSSIADTSYEPYIEETTNIYLDEPIEAKANIPSEYTEVEYLESTDTQYIDTSFKPTIYTSIETVFSTKAPTSDANLFGSRVSGGVQDYTIWINTSSNKGIACHFPFKSGSSRDTKWVYTGNIIDTPTKLLITPENIKVNDELVYTFTDTRTEYTPNLNAYIFARNDNGNSASLGRFKVYYFKIWDEGQLVRDLVPCYRKSDNVAGLYDLVNSTFYTNEGTENFIVGPIKENESISLSDTNVDIPTIDGTNVISIDTTVQPSNVYIQAPKDSLEAIQIANRLEEI